MLNRELSRTSLKTLRRELNRLVSGEEPVALDRVLAAREALDRLDTGTFGVCSDCGTRIPMMRLIACPEATRCVHCQARLDAYLAA